jgi:hypothetical protein
VHCAGSLKKRGEEEVRREGEGKKNEGRYQEKGTRKSGKETNSYLISIESKRNEINNRRKSKYE